MQRRDVFEGETEEEALQRRIDEGNVGKGETLRRWKDTEEKVSLRGLLDRLGFDPSTEPLFSAANQLDLSRAKRCRSADGGVGFGPRLHK